MHDALRVHDHVHLVHGDIEQPAGFDHLQSLVEQGGGIDGDLPAHGPGGVLERLFQSDVFQVFLLPGAEGASGGCQDQTGDGFRPPVVAVQALENGVVLAVHGQYAHSGLPRFFHHDLSGHDQNFLAGDGQVLPRLNGGQCRAQPRCAHDGNQHHVRLRKLCQAAQAFFPCFNLHTGKGAGEFLRPGQIVNADVVNAEFPCLEGQGLRVAAGGQAHHFHSVPNVPGYFQGAGSDGTRGTQDNDASFLHNGKE